MIAHLRCSYFQTPSSCESGGVNMVSILLGSTRICCWINSWTARVLSISSNGSSGHLRKNYKRCLCISYSNLKHNTINTLAFVPGLLRFNIFFIVSAIFIVSIQILRGKVIFFPIKYKNTIDTMEIKILNDNNTCNYKNY